MKKGTAVLVTDSHRGIYFGYFESRLENGNAVRLNNFRHCYYYVCKDGNEGTYGLATAGPQSGSKIGPQVSGLIRDVAKIVECSEEAVEAWEKATWGN